MLKVLSPKNLIFCNILYKIYFNLINVIVNLYSSHSLALPIPWTRHYPILIHQFTLHTHSFTGLHAQGKPRHTSKTITVISLHSLPMPLPLFGILLTQSCLILVFLPHIFILSCLYRQTPNLPLMLKLLVMTTGLRLCMLSYRLYNWITLGLLPFFLLTKLPLVVVGYIKSSTVLMGL